MGCCIDHRDAIAVIVPHISFTAVRTKGLRVRTVADGDGAGDGMACRIDHRDGIADKVRHIGLTAVRTESH